MCNPRRKESPPESRKLFRLLSLDKDTKHNFNQTFCLYHLYLPEFLWPYPLLIATLERVAINCSGAAKPGNIYTSYCSYRLNPVYVEFYKDQAVEVATFVFRAKLNFPLSTFGLPELLWPSPLLIATRPSPECKFGRIKQNLLCRLGLWEDSVLLRVTVSFEG